MVDNIFIEIDKTAKAYGSFINKQLQVAQSCISYEQFIILNSLLQQNGQSQIQISLHVERDKSSVTRILDTLEKRNLIERKVNKKDRRKNHIFHTCFGKQEALKAKKIVSDAEEKTLLNIDEVTYKSFKNILIKITCNLSHTL
jgi:DNA-binding MarR family transcriptional regulator